jgi:hypothetical protein
MNKQEKKQLELMKLASKVVLKEDAELLKALHKADSKTFARGSDSRTNQEWRDIHSKTNQSQDASKSNSEESSDTEMDKHDPIKVAVLNRASEEIQTPDTKLTREKQLENGCGKEWCEEGEDCVCGEDFPDDDGMPWGILCPECRAELKGIKEQKVRDILIFKENLLMTKTNHELGCMLECYQQVIENRIGFEKEAKQLLEIASKLK